MTPKPIQLQYDLPKGAKAFINIIDIPSGYGVYEIINNRAVIYPINEPMFHESIELPLQTGDEFYIKESVYSRMKDYEENGLKNCMEFDELINHSAEVINLVCVSVELKKVQDIKVTDFPSIETTHWMFDEWLDQNFGQGTYEQNPWVFVITFKEK